MRPVIGWAATSDVPSANRCNTRNSVRAAEPSASIARAPSSVAAFPIGASHGEMLVRRMPLDAGDIMFLDVAGRELRLQLPGEVPRAGEDDDAGRVGVEPMDGPQFLRMVGHVQNRLQRVAVEAARRMQRQRRGLVDDDDRLVFVQHADRRVHIGLRSGRPAMQIHFARSHALFGRHRLAADIEQQVLGEALVPILGRELRKDAAQRVEQRLAIVFRRDVERPNVVVRRAAGQRRGGSGDGPLALGDRALASARRR